MEAEILRIFRWKESRGKHSVSRDNPERAKLSASLASQPQPQHRAPPWVERLSLGTEGQAKGPPGVNYRAPSAKRRKNSTWSWEEGEIVNRSIPAHARHPSLLHHYHPIRNNTYLFPTNSRRENRKKAKRVKFFRHRLGSLAAVRMWGGMLRGRGETKTRPELRYLLPERNQELDYNLGRGNIGDSRRNTITARGATCLQKPNKLSAKPVRGQRCGICLLSLKLIYHGHPNILRKN